MTNRQLIDLLAQQPPDARMLCYYDSEELDCAIVYKRADGAIVISHEPAAVQIMSGYEDGRREPLT
jgi:hypothetical protein